MHLRYKKFDSVESRGRNDSSFSTDNLLRVVPRLIRRMRVISHLHVNISRNVVGLLSHAVIVYFFLLFFFFVFFENTEYTRDDSSNFNLRLNVAAWRNISLKATPCTFTRISVSCHERHTVFLHVSTRFSVRCF